VTPSAQEPRELLETALFEIKRVIAGQDASAPTRRLLTLPFLALASGLLLILCVGGWRLRRRLIGRDPIVVATLAMTAAELAGVVLGGATGRTTCSDSCRARSC